MKLMLFENIRIGLQSIRSHLLRTILTMTIIAFGIMALIGILTAIDSIKYSISSNFTMMGANTFTIRNSSIFIHSDDPSSRRIYKSIAYEEAIAFKERFTFGDQASVSFYATGLATAKVGSEKTNPNISVVGADENYLATSGLELASGRNFSKHEVETGGNVVIIGSEIKSKLFQNVDPVGKFVRVGPAKFMVIGVLTSKGSSMGFSGDRNCIVPVLKAHQTWNRSGVSFQINVLAPNAELIEPYIGEARGVFRSIRNLTPSDDDNFEIVKSDNLVNMLLDNIRYVTMAATIIGLITLLGAAIGLMNIMLVSVTERTREIGIRKATGANKSAVRRQFLVEAVVIGVLGGLIGIILGIAIGNIISLLLGSKFIIPWFWASMGVLLCVLVGLVSGLYPAVKAANLDPIESLRYE